MNHKQAMKEILNFYGDRAQIIKAIEELNELSVVLCKILNSKKETSVLNAAFKSEMADVEIMLYQLKLIFPNLDFNSDIDFKVNRTLEIIKNKQ